MAANHARHNAKSASGSPTTSLVLYGLDESGKPRAACFAARDAVLAKKAAGLMGLTVLPVASPQQTEIAAKLPAGRLYSSGRGLVPNIRATLYQRVIEAAGGLPATGQNGSKAEGQKPSPGSWPAIWDGIDVGHVVIAQEAEKDLGWSEAIVVHKNGDMFALRWKDPPNKKLTTRHRVNLALLYSDVHADTGSKGTATNGDVSSTKEEPNKPIAAKQAQAGHAYPTDWNEIDVGHLVLAKEDGPMESWWEAVVTVKDGDSFTLQWRDYTSLPTIVRQRFKLALICPTSLAATQSG
jgi:hypothetical protein